MLDENYMKNQFENNIENLFKDFYFHPEIPQVWVGRLHEDILCEIKDMVQECYKIRQLPLYFLKNHNNVGKNDFQMSVPADMFERSFTMAFLIHMGQHYLAKTTGLSLENYERAVRVKKHHGHFDNFDLWVNFIEPGNTNERHTHSSDLSGVIYLNNQSNLPTIFDHGSYNGQAGDIIMFPSWLPHSVDTNTSPFTRLTLAYNLFII